MIGINKYNDVEIGNESYRYFELNSSQQFGTGMVFKSLNNSTVTITIGYSQNTSNNIDVDVYICKLRKKLEDASGQRLIFTVRSKGYKIIIKSEWR